MAVIATPKNFSVQQVFEILGRKPLTKEILFYLTNTKTSGLENTVEMVYKWVYHKKILETAGSTLEHNILTIGGNIQWGKRNELGIVKSIMIG